MTNTTDTKPMKLWEATDAFNARLGIVDRFGDLAMIYLNRIGRKEPVTQSELDAAIEHFLSDQAEGD